MKENTLIKMLIKSFIFFLLISLVGCTSFKSMVPIENDQLRPDLGFDTILILDLEIQDHSSLLQIYGDPSIWDFYKGNIQKENRMTQHIFLAQWSQSKDGYTLHKIQQLETIAGIHKISTISFTHEDYIYRYEIMRQFELLPNSINYLGKIKITINKDGSYYTEIKNDKYSFQESLESFKSKNPSLYKKYGNKIEIAQTKTITDLSW